MSFCLIYISYNKIVFLMINHLLGTVYIIEIEVTKLMRYTGSLSVFW